MKEKVDYEEFVEFLEEVLPQHEPEVAYAIVALAHELIESGTPNGRVYSIGPSPDGRSIVIEVRYETGKTADQKIVEMYAGLTNLKKEIIELIDENNPGDSCWLVKERITQILSDVTIVGMEESPDDK